MNDRQLDNLAYMAAGAVYAELYPDERMDMTKAGRIANAIRRAFDGEIVEDNVFIAHILGHLQPGMEVVCKVCGKTAKQIQAEAVGRGHHQDTKTPK